MNFGLKIINIIYILKTWTYGIHFDKIIYVTKFEIWNIYLKTKVAGGIFEWFVFMVNGIDIHQLN